MSRARVTSKQFRDDPAGTLRRATERPHGLMITDAKGRAVGVLSCPTDLQRLVTAARIGLSPDALRGFEQILALIEGPASDKGAHELRAAKHVIERLIVIGQPGRI